MGLDLSRIDRLLLRENYILGLGYLEGLVFLRITGRSLVPLLYDPNQEIDNSNLVNISPNTVVSAQKFSSSDLNSTNILKTEADFECYQLFFGIAPSGVRVFTRIEGSDKMQLEQGNWGQNADYRFGFIDGHASSLDSPSPESERLVAPHIAYEWAVMNTLPYTVSPLFRFIINRCTVAVITDANLIERILTGTVPARLAYMGGIDPPKYGMKSKWQVEPVKVDATRDEIVKAVKV